MRRAAKRVPTLPRHALPGGFLLLKATLSLGDLPPTKPAGRSRGLDTHQLKKRRSGAGWLIV